MEIQTLMGHSASSAGNDLSRDLSRNLLQNSSQKLHLCLRRMHGKSVVTSPMPVPPEGVIMGGDTEGCENVALAASLHVVTRHALVRAAQAGEEGAWHIEPGNKVMVLAVNDARVPWGESRVLQHGDRLEVGFACFEVVTEACPVEAGAVDMAEMADSPLVAPVVATHVEPDSKTPETKSGVPSGEPLPPLDPLDPFVPLLLQPAPAPVSSPVEASGLESGPTEAELLAALLGECAALPESTGIMSGELSGGDVLAAIVREAEPVPPAPDPDDILAELAAESQRALAGGGMSSEIFTDFSVGYPVSRPQVTDNPDPFQAGAAMASVEEIVEGRLTIDDVLDRLRRRQGAMGNNMASEKDGIVRGDAATIMDVIAREPDPLLLLAGMENQPVREPELAPVLHREHRATGIRSPYRIGATQTTGDVAGENQQPEQEEPCPLPR